MRIGILLCDHVDKDRETKYGTYLEMFERLLPDIDFRPYYVCDNDFPDNVFDCDGYLVNGSRYSVYDDIPWINILKEFTVDIHQAQLGYVGVCFGHQVLAEALGGKVDKSTVGWCVGVHAFELIQPRPWMDPGSSHYKLLMMCQDQVVKLPPDSQILASSTECKVGMFTVGKNMLGIQAHPEFSTDYVSHLLGERVKKIGATKVAEAMDTLHQQLDAVIISTWIRKFFSDRC